MSDNIKKVLLVGAGYMASEYAKVIFKIIKKENLTVIGRGIKNNKNFFKITKIKPQKIELNKFLRKNYQYFDHAVIAVGIKELYDVCKILIKFKIKNILLEKPGALYLKQLQNLVKLQNKYKNNIYIALNRRYYNSTIEAKKLITNDGGVKSFKFDFTERSHIISKEKTLNEIKQQWFLANSLHVIDLAFYLGGIPNKITNYTFDKTSWHKKGAIFSGSGSTKKKALFSYHANWKAPGRWSLDFFTKNKHIIFMPLEELSYINIKSEKKKIKINDKDDILFKAGLFKMTNIFLTGKKSQLPKIKEHTLNIQNFYRLFVKDKSL